MPVTSPTQEKLENEYINPRYLKYMSTLYVSTDINMDLCKDMIEC